MKYYTFLMSLVTIILISQISIAAEPIVQATFSISPSVSSPGSDGYIQVTLKNTGGAAANSVIVTLTSTDAGISVDANRAITIGGIGAGETISSLFKFSVPKKTSPGLYTINFKINYCQDSTCREINQFAIVTVQSQSTLELKFVKPDRLNVGSNTTLIFTIVNNGNYELSNVVITWQESNNLILPLGLSNRIVIASIEANKQTDMPVEVVTSPTITPGAYPISVKMEYFDKTGAKQNFTSVVGLIVGGTTDFSVDMQEFASNTITLSIANIGVNPATSVSMSLPEQENFKIAGAQSIFLGNLNPGDSTVASFSINPVNSNAANKLHAKISYTDTSGLRQEFGEDLVVKSTGELQPDQSRVRQQQGNFLYFIVGIIVIVLLAYFISKRKKRH